MQLLLSALCLAVSVHLLRGLHLSPRASAVASLAQECALGPAAAAAQGMEASSAASVVLSMLPVGPKRALVIGEASARLEPLVRLVGVEGVTRLTHEQGVPANGTYDLIVDTKGGDGLPSRVQDFFGLLQYQGLYVAEDVELCATGSAAPSCDGWWRLLVDMLHRPGGAGKEDYSACHPERGCDLPLESFHVWKGMMALRKGQVHYLWDQKRTSWLPPHAPGGHMVLEGAELTEAQAEHKEYEATDQRSDGCWQNRKAFLDMCLAHDADKGTIHGYWRAYGALLQRFRTQADSRLCEFGLANGASARVWADFLADDAVFHMNDLTTQFFDSIMQSMSAQKQRRTHLHEVGMDPGAEVSGARAWQLPDFDWNATTAGIANMVSEARKNGDFDIIIDDAGHSPLQNFMFFQALIRRVKQTGFYICEDLEAGGFLGLNDNDVHRPQLFQGIRQFPTPVDMFVAVTRKIAGGSSDTACEGCESLLAAAHWYHETVLFERNSASA